MIKDVIYKSVIKVMSDNASEIAFILIPLWYVTRPSFGILGEERGNRRPYWVVLSGVYAVAQCDGKVRDGIGYSRNADAEVGED